MAWRYTGRASVDPENPQAFAVCDRCGFWYNRVDLVTQYQWVGPQLQSKNILVCTVTCLDDPNEQLRTIVLPPDPPSVYDARPEFFSIAEIDQLQSQSGSLFVTQSGDALVTSPSTTSG